MQITDITASVLQLTKETVTDEKTEQNVSVNTNGKVTVKSDSKSEISRKSDTVKKDSVEFSQNAQMLIEQFQQAQESADATAEGFEDMVKCLTIASRIIAGDKVPISDIKFLQEKDHDLYYKAEMLKANNPKPKKHKSLVEDEEDEQVESVSSEKLEEAMNDNETQVSESSGNESGQQTAETTE